MAYEIDQRNEADYRWFRFEAPTELLEQLDHNLKIADGVLRFRIFKVDPDTPVMVPPATAAPGPAASRERPAQSAPPAAPPTPSLRPLRPRLPLLPSPSPSLPPRQSPSPRRPSRPLRPPSPPLSRLRRLKPRPSAAEGEPGDSAA